MGPIPGLPLKRYDATRPMADCADRFVREYAQKLWLLSAAALNRGLA
jgi:hypothetical protein